MKSKISFLLALYFYFSLRQKAAGLEPKKTEKCYLCRQDEGLLRSCSKCDKLTCQNCLIFMLCRDCKGDIEPIQNEPTPSTSRMPTRNTPALHPLSSYCNICQKFTKQFCPICNEPFCLPHLIKHKNAH